MVFLVISRFSRHLGLLEPYDIALLGNGRNIHLIEFCKRLAADTIRLREGVEALVTHNLMLLNVAEPLCLFALDVDHIALARLCRLGHIVELTQSVGRYLEQLANLMRSEEHTSELQSR